MARKKDEVELQLARLHKSADLSTDECAAVAVELIGHKSNIVVGQAARVILDRELECDHDRLRAAYERFLLDPTETDKGCRAKLPVCEALVARAFEDADFFIEGMKYVQLDPAYGGAVDSAPDLRGMHAYGLLGCRFLSWTSVMHHLVDLLNDSMDSARSHAARAIGEQRSPAAVWLLRHHVQRDEFSTDVIGECLRGMMRIDGDNDDTLEFVQASLFADPATAAEAAEALCQSRRPKAIRAVIDACESPGFASLEAALLSLAICREQTATAYLLSQIRSGESLGEVAVKSMAPNRYYPDIFRQVEEAVELSGSLLLERAFEQHFKSAK